MDSTEIPEDDGPSFKGSLSEHDSLLEFNVNSVSVHDAVSSSRKGKPGRLIKVFKEKLASSRKHHAAEEDVQDNPDITFTAEVQVNSATSGAKRNQ